MDFFVSNVLAYRLNSSWWELGKEKRGVILKDLKKVLVAMGDETSGTLKAEAYSSLRYDCNLLFWLIVKDPVALIEAKSRLEKVLGPHASIKHGFLSIYERKNPKLHGVGDYLVAYPISKDPEWYLLDKNERSEIMSEHIKLAISHPNNKGINSYTTISFGIDDNEFVVLYELDSISDWVLVAQGLRETVARKWISSERPIMVGSKRGLKALLA